MEFSCYLITNIRQVKLGGIGKVLLKMRSLGAFRTPLLVVSSYHFYNLAVHRPTANYQIKPSGTLKVTGLDQNASYPPLLTIHLMDIFVIIFNVAW